MKVTLTAEVIHLTDFPTRQYGDLPDDVRQALNKMPASEKKSRSLLFIDGYDPRIIDDTTVRRYYPMALPMTFAESVALLAKSDKLVMTRHGITISFTGQEYLSGGKPWVPFPRDIVSQEKNWYVHPKDQPNQEKTESTGDW